MQREEKIVLIITMAESLVADYPFRSEKIRKSDPRYLAWQDSEDYVSFNNKYVHLIRYIASLFPESVGPLDDLCPYNKILSVDALSAIPDKYILGCVIQPLQYNYDLIRDVDCYAWRFVTQLMGFGREHNHHEEAWRRWRISVLEQEILGSSKFADLRQAYAELGYRIKLERL